MKRKIAVPIDETGLLNAHFGHSNFFAIQELEGSKVVAEEILQPPPHEPGVLPQWLAEIKVTDVIAGGMGNRAIQHFNQLGVNVFVGAPKMKCEELIQGLVTNSIEFSANYCDH